MKRIKKKEKARINIAFCKPIRIRSFPPELLRFFTFFHTFEQSQKKIQKGMMNGESGRHDEDAIPGRTKVLFANVTFVFASLLLLLEFTSIGYGTWRSILELTSYDRDV